MLWSFVVLFLSCLCVCDLFLVHLQMAKWVQQHKERRCGAEDDIGIARVPKQALFF